MTQSLRRTLKRALLEAHKLATRFGIHVLPVHYHSPVPNIVELQRRPELWLRKSELPGLSVDLDAQAESLLTICRPYQHEYEGNRFYREAVSSRLGPGYGYIEAQALHGFVRFYKPKRIVEVGSGVSTYCMLKASEMNAKETGQVCEIVSIEPYPSSALRSLPGIKLMNQPAQTVPFDVFMSLRENDLLFIDSSHAVKPGSDVNYLILEVLPRLQGGVIVHFHDIFLPYDYQRDVLQSYLHWNETSLLHAFLIFNARVEILVCLSQLHYERRAQLSRVFPEYVPQVDDHGLLVGAAGLAGGISSHFPSSTYIRVRQ